MDFSEGVRLVKDMMSPKVLVVASEDATALCMKNRVSFTQLIRPFGRMPKKTAVEYDKQRHQVSLCVEFVDETRFVEERVAALLANVVASQKNVEDPYGGVQLRGREDVARIISGSSSRDLTPWFTDFALQFGLSIGSVEHETFGHPVACVVVISSGCADAVMKMRETFEMIRQNIRSLFPEGLAPASLQAQFVLLHDDHEGPTQAALDKLRELQSSFGGQHCHLLKVNSLDLMQVHSVTGLQTFLSEADWKSLDDFARHVAVSLVVPKLMETLSTSLKQLEARKKTFGDAIATWWGGAKKTAPAEELPPGNLKYAPSSVVVLYRKVADAAFLLQLYDLAYAQYRACAKEVKKTQDEWLAGCVEMATISSFLTHSAPRDFELDLEKAIKYYASCQGLQRFGLRCSILAAIMCKASRNFLKAGAFLADYAESAAAPLVAALLQEQASLCLLYLEQPRFRRLAFRLVFAARKFIGSGHYLHALRCYRFAHGVYAGHDWRMIDDHLRFSLARQLASHDRLEEALDLFQLLLCDVVASKDRQASYLREFMFLAARVPPPRNSPCGLHVLAMPIVDQSSARIASGSALSGDDELVWVKLEKELTLFGSKFHRRSISAVVKTNRPNDCAVGEPAVLEVKLCNPLSVPLQLSGIRVVAHHEPIIGGQTSAADGAAAFVCDSCDVFITAGSSATIRLAITPQIPGMLKVRGLQAVLFGTLPIVMRIVPPMVRSTRAGLRSGSGSIPLDESRALDLSVCNPMPLLQCEFEGPSHVASGQLVSCRLKLSNSGKTEMRSIRVKTSHPGWMHFGMADSELPFGLSTRVEPFRNELRDLSVWDVPVASLAPGESTTVFVWLRASVDAPGVHVVKLLWQYEAVAGGGRRLYRFGLPLTIGPMIRGVLSSCWPVHGSVDSYLVGLSVSNHSEEEVWVDQIACASLQWTAVAVQDLCSLGKLAPRQSAILAFRLGPRQEEMASFGFQTPLLRHNVRELDGAKAPLFQLLEREVSERGLSRPEDMIPDSTFVSSAAQVCIFWSCGNGVRGVDFLADVSPFGEFSGSSSSNSVVATASAVATATASSSSGPISAASPSSSVASARKVATLVTPGVPLPAPPLRFGLLLAKKSIEHDFSAGHLCLVPCSVVIHNATGAAVCGMFHAHSPPLSGVLHARQCYVWLGAVTQKFSVEPRSSVTISLGLGFNSVGVFSIDRFSLTVNDQVLIASHPEQIEVTDKAAKNF